MKSHYTIQWHERENYPCIVSNDEHDASIVKLEFRVSEDVLNLKDGNKVFLYHEYFKHNRLIEYSERELSEIVKRYPKINLIDLKASEFILIKKRKFW